MNQLTVLFQYAQGHPTTWLVAVSVLVLYVFLANFRFKTSRDIDLRLSQLLTKSRDVDTRPRSVPDRWGTR